jgi:hypothetical protein
MYKKYKLIKEELSLSGGANEKITNVKIINEELKLLDLNEKKNFCKKDINDYNIYIGNENFFKELEEMKKEKKQLKLKNADNKGAHFGTHTVFFNENNLLKEIKSVLNNKFKITEIILDIYDLTEEKDIHDASDDFVKILIHIKRLIKETPLTDIIEDLSHISKHKDDYFDDIDDINNLNNFIENNYIERLKIINLDLTKLFFNSRLKRFDDVLEYEMNNHLNIFDQNIIKGSKKEQYEEFKESMNEITKILAIINILEMEFNFHIMGEFGEFGEFGKKISFDDIDDDQFNICYIEKNTFRWKSKKNFNKDDIEHFKLLFPPIRDNKNNNIHFKGIVLFIKRLKQNY